MRVTVPWKGKREKTGLFFIKIRHFQVVTRSFFILIYMKQYTTQIMLAKLFGIFQPVKLFF